MLVGKLINFEKEGFKQYFMFEGEERVFLCKNFLVGVSEPILKLHLD